MWENERNEIPRHWLRLAFPVVIALGALSLWASCGEDSVSSPSITSPTPSASPIGASALPDILKGQTVILLQPGAPAEFPKGLSVIVETGCWQCDGPTESLMRVSRDLSGNITTERIFEPLSLGITRRVTGSKGVEELPPFITGYVVSGDTREIAVSVCVREFCGGGLEPWSADSVTALYRSTDGGATWSKYGELPAGGLVSLRLEPGVFLMTSYEGGIYSTATLRRIPGLEVVQRPDSASPVAVMNGEIIWNADGRLIHSDGRLLIDFGLEAGAPGRRGVAVLPNGDLRVIWTWRPNRSQETSFISILHPDGTLGATYAYRGFLLNATRSVDSVTLIGNSDFDLSKLSLPSPTPVFDYLPSLFDLQRGIIHPILAPFTDPGFPRGRNHIVGVRQE